MADIITTLHPENNPDDNLYPNIKRENIPFDVSANKNLVQPYGELTSLDLNTIRESCVYKIIGSAIVNGPTNLDTSKGYLLTSYKLKFVGSQDVIYQELRYLNGTMTYNRQYTSGSWSSWNQYDFIKNYTLNKNLVQAYGEVTSLDLNTIRESCVYKIIGSAIVNGPTNLDTSKGYLLTSYKLKFVGSQDVIYQELKLLDGSILFTRQYTSGSWSSWSRNELLKRNVIEIGANKQYTSIVEGFERAFALGNCDVYIYGTFDLMNESPSFYTSSRGLKVGKNNNYYFAPESKIIFNYTGDDTYTLTEFSPINNFNYGSFSIHNLNIECSRCRYCVHDECGGAKSGVYQQHIYDNCNMYIDNTNNPSFTTKNCIGGGLNNDVKIEIRNSFFNAKDSTIDVAYHTNWETSISSSKCNLVIVNNFFAHKFNFVSLNPNESGTIIYTNNVTSSELPSITNFIIKQWNNVNG